MQLSRFGRFAIEQAGHRKVFPDIETENSDHIFSKRAYVWKGKSNLAREPPKGNVPVSLFGPDILRAC